MYLHRLLVSPLSCPIHCFARPTSCRSRNLPRAPCSSAPGRPGYSFWPIALCGATDELSRLAGLRDRVLRKRKRKIGRGMQTDVEDGARWAVAQGIADPTRMAIVGASYGGYSALYALGNSPELYRCGISIANVTDRSDIIKGWQGEEYKFAFLHF